MPPHDDKEEVSLREYFEKELELRDRAVELASKAMDYRLERMNELREQINNERGHFVSETMYSERHKELQRRLTNLELWRANLTGRVVGVGLIAIVFTGVLTALLTHLTGA